MDIRPNTAPIDREDWMRLVSCTDLADEAKLVERVSHDGRLQEFTCIIDDDERMDTDIGRAVTPLVLGGWIGIGRRVNGGACLSRATPVEVSAEFTQRVMERVMEDEAAKHAYR